MRAAEGVIMMLMVLGIFLIMMGVHNIDNSFNMKYVQTESDICLVDWTASGYASDANQVYSIGVMIIILGTALFSAMTIILLIYRTEVEKKCVEEQR